MNLPEDSVLHTPLELLLRGVVLADSFARTEIEVFGQATREPYHYRLTNEDGAPCTLMQDVENGLRQSVEYLRDRNLAIVLDQHPQLTVKLLIDRFPPPDMTDQDVLEDPRR